MTGPSEEQMECFLIATMWQGPWERIMNWAYGIDRNNELKFEISQWKWHWRHLLARFAERRNEAWLHRWANRHQDPPKRWRRRVVGP